MDDGPSSICTTAAVNFESAPETRSGPDRTTVLPPSQEPNTSGTSRAPTALPPDLLLNAIISDCGGSDAARRELINLKSSAARAENLMGDDVEVHCLVVIKNSDGVRTMYPTHSVMLETALRASSPGADIACQTLADGFRTARRIYELIHQQPSRTHAPSIQFTLPEWFPYIEQYGVHASEISESRPPVYIICDESAMQGLLNTTQVHLTNVYGRFFNHLYRRGLEKGLVTGKMIYSVLTPPWMRVFINFVYGPNRNRTIPFNDRVLPRKQFIQKKPQKQLLAAIIATWLKKEPQSAALIHHLLSQGGTNLLRTNARNENTGSNNNNVRAVSSPVEAETNNISAPSTTEY